MTLIQAKARTFAIKHQWPLAQAAAVCAFLGAAGTFALFGPPKLVHMTETPQFCALCHSSQDMDWSHSSHRTARCIDCHLPNDNQANHYLWKAIDGGKDTFLHFSGLGDGNHTELTGHGGKVLQDNCIRCHTDMVSRIGSERSCIDCHRTLRHRRTASNITNEGLHK